MYIKILLSCHFGLVLSDKACYWNAQCPFQLYSSKTPYDTVRGDIRDYPDPQNCKAASVWSLHRHGNRNPGGSVTDEVKDIAKLKEEVIASYDAGTSHLCCQDIEEFRKWSWNETLELSQSFLTGVGYEELFDIGKRIRERYPHLLTGNNDSYYFRSTVEQRTITSAIAFVHGLTEKTNLSLPIDDVREQDDIIRPYAHCDRYQKDVKEGEPLMNEIKNYFNTAEFKAVETRVQKRLGITTTLSAEEVYALYEICRFFRSWSSKLQSPWCSVFTEEDLIVLEYKDDVRHYYRNGYGSRVNVMLGGPPLKDLYENFEAAVQNRGKNIVSYFTHDTMLEMVFCAMGIYRDAAPVLGSQRDENRRWRTSYMAPFAANIIAVLNRCQESGTQTYQVQFFINEKQTELCPFEGCTWQQFQEKFQGYSKDLDFCSVDYKWEEDGFNGGVTSNKVNGVLVMCLVTFVTAYILRRYTENYFLKLM